MGCAYSCRKDDNEPVIQVPISELGKPSQPCKPECKKIDNTNIEITWSPPEGDGGDQVTGYVVQQHHERSSEDWVTIEELPINTTYTFTDMDPGTYQFRILAENSVGKSDPSDTSESITILAPLEIQLRGPEALAAYQEALKEGKEEIHCIRLMLVGQERVGKTSLVKAFMGHEFEEKEEITDGVDASNACSVPFSEPSNWKPLSRNTEKQIEQLNEKHCYGVGFAAACNLDPSLKEKETSRPKEHPYDGKDFEEYDSDDTSEREMVTQKTKPFKEDKGSNDGMGASKTDAEKGQSTEGDDDRERMEIPGGSASTQGSQPESPDNQEDGSEKDRTDTLLSTTTSQEKVTEIPEGVKKAKKPAEDLEITFWDFAGQDLYYTTHQVFFNRRAVFALVFDMSKKLKDQCVVCDFSVPEENTRRFDDFTGEDFLKFWLQSIYTYAVHHDQDSADSKYPPIFLIGTHKRDPNAIAEERVKKQIFRIIKRKPYETYIRRKFHFLENNPDQKQPSDDEALVALKEAIATSAMNAPHMKEKYPIKWLNFHKAVLQKVDSGTHYMKYEQAKELAASLQITDESQFTTMLNLYHDLGAIIWFGDQGQGLKNTVILDPQWLIDVFKAVITVKPDEEQDADFSPLWQELQEHGILREQLINHVWKSWLDIKEDLLEIMETFDIMVKNILKKEDENEKDGETHDEKQSLEYCVPACLQPVDKSEDENIMDGTFYVDFGNFLPDGFFHRVLVYFSRWSSAHTGEAFKLFYRKCESVVGRAENLHECSLLMIPSSTQSDTGCIKVVVKRIAKHGNAPIHNEPDPEVCTMVFEFISKTLQELKGKWAKGISYTMSVSCVACRDAGRQKLHLIPVKKCKGTQPFFCPRMKQEIAARKLYWNVKTDSLSTSDKPSESADQNKQDSPSSSDNPSLSKPADQNKQGQHIMVSYSWGNREKGFPCQQRMIQLKDKLEEAGLKVWLDVSEMRGNMDDRMAEAVNGASVILLCYSKEYQKSNSCKKEAQYARYKNKPIIPLKFDGHKPDGWLGLLICSLLYHDVRSEEAMKKNLPAIIKDIEAYVYKPSKPADQNKQDKSDMGTDVGEYGQYKDVDYMDGNKTHSRSKNAPPDTAPRNPADSRDSNNVAAGRHFNDVKGDNQEPSKDQEPSAANKGLKLKEFYNRKKDLYKDKSEGLKAGTKGFLVKLGDPVKRPDTSSSPSSGGTVQNSRSGPPPRPPPQINQAEIIEKTLKGLEKQLDQPIIYHNQDVSFPNRIAKPKPLRQQPQEWANRAQVSYVPL